MLRKLKMIGLALAGFFVALGLAFLKGRKAGVEHIEREQSARRIQSMKDRKEVDDEVSNLGSNDLDSDLNRWLRDHDR
ncbi:hypothetical protein [Devosia sp. MC521]|uniref:hypothetical protein n=1 Tax=Devosia sp. MC521 TaxID=2759954 RepID=UPI0015FC09A3|nr:hypothetical protein [Devosia sp. MC521]MBJ6986954.1 hypothetical protein [Devosia sp. MC521]QMW63978.1 hypothetical protein H4N61_06580 [Devosia sp. MC521]